MSRTKRFLFVFANVPLFLLVLHASFSEASDILGESHFLFQGNDGAPGDLFGYSVSSDGSLGIIGAPGDDSQLGAAYLFDLETGTQLAKFSPANGAVGDRFGTSVSIEGNLAIVGSLHHQGTGAAYVYDVNSGQQLYQLLGHDTVLGDEYGVSVDISGTRAIVGAHKANTGKAYVYDLTNGTQITSLISDDASPNDLFGVAVAIDGTTALVGARYDDDFDTASGSAYLFDALSGQQLHKLNAHDAAWGDRFGMYLDLDGNTALVASRYDDDERKSSGSAYLFDVDTGLERYKLVADDMNANDHFGSSISLSGDFALIGAANDYDFVPFGGSAYIFDVHSGQQVLKLFPQDPGVLDQFGTAVSLDGNRALVGAMQSAFDGSVNATGKAYVYDLNLVPEPSAAFPLLLGLTFLAWIGRRK